MVIESSQNKLVKKLNSWKSKKYRIKDQVFLAEGIRFISEIPQETEVLFYACSESFAKKENLEWIKNKAQVYVFSDHLFPSFCDTEHPQGILAVCRQKKLQFCADEIKKNGLYLLAEELNDPGNLGTVIRTAHACGVDGVILSKGTVDVYSPKVLRSTMGSIFHVPLYTDLDLKEVIPLLRQKEITVMAAHLKAEQYPYDINCKKGCAILIGNEANGLKDETAALCNAYVKIPMPGGAESLNASVAAAVLLYEAVRQRLSL